MCVHVHMCGMCSVCVYMHALHVGRGSRVADWCVCFVCGGGCVGGTFSGLLLFIGQC